LQTTLLGIALALIALILAAFAAPLFIDWNEWRPQLEAQTSALAGSRVTISGNIDLTLLPTPAFVLRDVSVGDAEKGSGMRANEMRGSLSLTALISGKIEASEFVLSKPAIRLVIEKDGKFLLPDGASAGQEISVSGFVLEAGSLTVEDRRTNSTFAVDDLSARGELVSREGPFRLDGGFRSNGVRWILRASSGRFGPDHSGKVRIALERPADNFSFEAEGLLTLADAAPRFDGKMSAAQKSGALPWRVTSDATGDTSEIRFGNLELALGQGELPITLAGEAKLTPRAGGALEISLSSKRIDLDLGDQKAATAGAGHVLPLLSEARELLGAIPLPSQVAISADGILAGGQLMRDVRANFHALNGAVALERLEAKLPGRASISLSGKTEKDKFSGPLSFEAEEPQIFARWLLGEELSAKFMLPAALSLRAMLDLAPDNYSLQKIQLAAGATKISGEVVAYLYSPPREYRVEANLSASEVDLDGVLTAVGNTFPIPDNIWLVANLASDKARFLKTPAKRINISASKFFGGAPELTSVVVEDFDGLTLTAKRKTEKDKIIEFSAEVIRSGGLTRALEYFSGSADYANIAARYAASHFPLRLSGTLTPEDKGWRASMNSAEIQAALFLGELRNSRQPVDALLRLPETEISAKGEFRLGPEGRFEPVLALNFKSADLRKAFVLADRASANTLPAYGTANLLRDGNSFVFDKLAFALAGAKGSGRLAFPAGETSPFSGHLAFDRVSAGTLLALAIGRANVSYLELGVPILANFPGRLKVEIESLAVSERVSLQKAAFEMRVGRFETVFDDFRAQLAGGKVSGFLRIADTLPRVLEIKLDAADVSLAALFGAKALRGTLRTALALSAHGNTHDDLLTSVAGKGTLVLTGLEIDRTDATAVSTVLAGAARNAPDEKKIEQALLAALDRTSLKVSKLEAPLVIANGVLRSGSAKAQAGNIEISLSGSLNIPKWMAEALLNIEVTGNSPVKPGAVVRWAGPPDAPERSVDAKALIAAITLRAIERGGQNINLQEDRAVPAKKKRQPAKSEIETAPLLPPPANVPPAPQPRSQN
jgi:hypothetical protein